jgi:nucleoside-diphosphate-sugar epimerase
MSDYFITGATGFLGGAVARRLASLGHSVVGVGRNEQAGKKLAQAGAKFYSCDLSDISQLTALIPEGAIVIHCAALSSIWGSRKEFYAANVIGTANVAQAALIKKCQRFIHISSPSIYITQKSQMNIREDLPLSAPPINLYAETKRIAEREIDAWTRQGLPAITLRPQGIFGPHDPSLMPRFIRIAKKKIFPKIGKHDVQIDLTYIDNAVDAVLLAASAAEKCIGQKYNISNGEAVDLYVFTEKTLREIGHPVKFKNFSFPFLWSFASLLEFVYKLFPFLGEPPITRYSVCVLSFSRTLNLEKAKTDLGYIPKVSVQQGLTQYVAWYLKQPGARDDQ